jgi:hypothetical protein
VFSRATNHDSNHERSSSSNKKKTETTETKNGFRVVNEVISDAIKAVIEPQGKSALGLDNLSDAFLKLIGQDGDQTQLADILSFVQGGSEDNEADDTNTLLEIFALLEKYKGQIGEIFQREDEVKNPTWKRRMHRFCKSLDMSEIDELNEWLSLAHWSYGDTVQEIRETLENHHTHYELVYCNTKSEPGKPAHFLAVERSPSGNGSAQSLLADSDTLHVVLVVRVTKSVDLVCDAVDYQGGKAHAFVLESCRCEQAQRAAAPNVRNVG